MPKENCKFEKKAFFTSMGFIFLIFMSEMQFFFINMYIKFGNHLLEITNF